MWKGWSLAFGLPTVKLFPLRFRYFKLETFWIFWTFVKLWWKVSEVDIEEMFTYADQVGKSSQSSLSSSSSTLSSSSSILHINIPGPGRSYQLRRVPNNDQPSKTSGAPQTHHGWPDWASTTETSGETVIIFHLMIATLSTRIHRPRSQWQQCWPRPRPSSLPTTVETLLPMVAMGLLMPMVGPPTQTNGAQRDKSQQLRLSDNP